MTQYLALTILTLSSSIVPSIVTPLLLALLLWRGRVSLPHALRWLSGPALALGLVDIMFLYLIMFWSQHGVFRTIMPHQDLFPYVLIGVEILLADIANACTIAAVTIGLFATTQQRQWRWALAFLGGALVLWSTIRVNIWGSSLLQMLGTLRHWSAVSVSLLAHLVALIPLVYGLTQPPRPLATGTQPLPLSVTAQPQPDRETKVADDTAR